jgi:hypothetical protein
MEISESIPISINLINNINKLIDGKWSPIPENSIIEKYHFKVDVFRACLKQVDIGSEEYQIWSEQLRDHIRIIMNLIDDVDNDIRK